MIWHKCCLFLVLKGCITVNYQTVLLALVLAFTHQVIISTLLMINDQKLHGFSVL